MATAEDVRSELMGENAPEGHHDSVMHDGGPTGLRKVVKTLQAKATYAAHEVTLWLPRRALKDADLGVGKPRKVDTTLGHAIDAASFGRINYVILSRIAKKLEVDISDLANE